MYCQNTGHECKITMQRKQRPFYYASEEQYRWLQIIAKKINPNANLNDISQLKEMAESLDSLGLVKREPGGEEDGYGDEEERPGHSVETPVNIEQEEGMEGVVDGIGTLMLDPLGRQSMYLTDGAYIRICG
jgi:hypothetical protein